MRTTTKYDKILPGNGTDVDSPVNRSGNQQPVKVQTTRDFDVISTEVRAIITKAFEADEPNNIQS